MSRYNVWIKKIEGCLVSRWVCTPFIPLSSSSIPSNIMISSVFQSLSATYPTWEQLSTYLKSEGGGALRIDDESSATNPYALIRYVKGKSNLALAHVRVFRSVVWDVLKNVPVSVAPVKSMDGESLPQTTNDSTAGFTIEQFVDGVMICGFWDSYSSQWRFHTRSTLDANSRYYSQSKTFLEMFKEAVNTLTNDSWAMFLNMLYKNVNYTWVLQHPENRIVVATQKPKFTLVQAITLKDGLVEPSMFHNPLVELEIKHVPTWSALRVHLAQEVQKHKHNVLGFVVKDTTGQRWKIRSPVYTKIRTMRGNSARRDYLWLDLWRKATLNPYLKIYPEETQAANAIVEKWKTITNNVYHLYCDVFKARSLPKTEIPPKYRPFVFGLHSLYLNNLKPQQKTVDWKTTLQFMNERDTAQALYAINWDLRPANQSQSQAPSVEATTTAGTNVVALAESQIQVAVPTFVATSVSETA